MQHDDRPDHATVRRAPAWYSVAVPGLLAVLATVIIVAGS